MERGIKGHQSVGKQRYTYLALLFQIESVPENLNKSSEKEGKSCQMWLSFQSIFSVWLPVFMECVSA